ncbi:MAG: glucose 1-dehydrogenase [Verrucomicrobiales bacterium]|nr:glucose 1-dehydrogenase [Verrucomicrobiales bacterium]
MKSFENKTVVITGGTSGIGRATAIAFAEAGANVVVGGRRESEGAEVVSAIEAAGARGLFVATDVVQESSIENLIQQAAGTFGSVDVAFNNAGVEGHSIPVSDETGENYDFVFDINVRGVLLSMKHEIAQFRKQESGGVVINTASVLGETAVPGASVYNASKHAVIGLTKTAALEVSAEGIRVVGISPAVIATDMYDRFTGGDEGAQQYMVSQHPIGRIGRQEEVAKTVLFLASDDASFITGSSIAIDGGWLAK